MSREELLIMMKVGLDVCTLRAVVEGASQHLVVVWGEVDALDLDHASRRWWLLEDEVLLRCLCSLSKLMMNLHF